MLSDSPSPRGTDNRAVRSSFGDLPLFTVLTLASVVLVFGLADGRRGGEDGAERGGERGEVSAAAREVHLGERSSRDRDGLNGLVGPSFQRTPGTPLAAPHDSSDSVGGGDEPTDLGLHHAGGRDRSLDSDGTGAAGSGPGRTRDAFGLRERGEFALGVREGRWEKLWPDGTLESEGDFHAGLREGLWTSYSALGAVLQEAHYAAGSLHGDWRAYGESGTLIGAGQYEENLRSGRWTLFYSDGQVKESGRYVHGLREGPWEFYDDLGHPTVRTGEYRAGIKID